MENGYGLGNPMLQSEGEKAAVGGLRRPHCGALPSAALGSSTKKQALLKATADGTALVN